MQHSWTSIDVIPKALANDTGRKLSLKPSLTLQEKIIRAICKSCGPLVNTRNLQRHLKGVLMDTIKVELEGFQRAGFGELKKIRNSNVFFKILGTLLDEDIGPHVNLIKIAGQDVATYHAYCCDVTKLSAEMIAICRQHPHVHILLAENIL